MRKKQKIRILEQVTVEDYAAEGKSIARVDGKVVFIPNKDSADAANENPANPAPVSAGPESAPAK